MQQVLSAVGSPQDRNQTGEDEQRTGGKKRRITLQVADHAGVRHALLAQQQTIHPVPPIEVQHTSQTRGITPLVLSIIGVTNPAQQKPANGK